MAFFTVLLAATMALKTTLAAPTWPLFTFNGAQVSSLQPPKSDLATPAAGMKLKYVGLGIGTQNYTCAGKNAADPPAATGAIATLHDYTQPTFLATQLPADWAAKALAESTCRADKPDSLAAALPVLGHHWFSAAGVPTFDLSQGSKSADAPDGLFLSAKKVAAANAPADACAGNDASLAVPWLMLADDGRGVSRDVAQVFRVETTGGAAAKTCQGITGEFTHDYAALYYFYG